MDVNQPSPMLGGLSPQAFMKRHWQKKPLVIRNAFADGVMPLSRGQLFDLAARDGVESRLIRRSPPVSAALKRTTETTTKPADKIARDKLAKRPKASEWHMTHGPFGRRTLPALKTPGWTLLVQGVDLHVQAVHELLQQFCFVPQARLDDVMVSFATDGGGVGPHFDSYDVFLLQAQGSRLWRVGRQKDLSLQRGVPLKLLQHFEPEEVHLLHAGDMLYLPPRWAHDGVAQGECLTYSIGFRAPGPQEIASDVLQRLADGVGDSMQDVADTANTGMRLHLYRDPNQVAVASPGAVPSALQEFTRAAVHNALKEPGALNRALGELLTEPKHQVWFEAQENGTGSKRDGFPLNLCLDRRTRMMYDERHIFINGESYRAAGRDARLLHELADSRKLPGATLRLASAEARELLAQWLQAGWLHGD